MGRACSTWDHDSARVFVASTASKKRKKRRREARLLRASLREKRADVGGVLPRRPVFQEIPEARQSSAQQIAE